jgi:hypothetical protein
MRIKSNDLPLFVNEKSLSIGYWDGDMWVGMPTEVAEPGLLKAQLSHFSMYAIVMCGGGTEPEIVIDSPKLYFQEYSLQTVDKDENGNKLYNVGVNEEFCNPDSEEFWKKDKDTIIPSPKEFLKILKEDDERIMISIEDIMRTPGGPFTFHGIIPHSGLDDDSMCHTEATVTANCCCVKDGDAFKCTPDEHVGVGDLNSNSLWSQQDCMSYLFANGYTELEEMIFLEPTSIENPDDYPLFDIDDNPIELSCADVTKPEGIKTHVFGYRTEECIDGYTKEEGKNVFEVHFKGNGDACRFEAQDDGKFYEIEYEQEYGTLCEGSDELIYVSGSGTKLGNEKIVTDTIVYGLEEITQVKTDNYCADCSAKITIYGKGLEYDGEITYSCENLNNYDEMFDEDLSYDIMNNEGTPTCYHCEDVNGELTYVKQDVSVCDPYLGCGPCLSLELGGSCPPSEEGNNWCSNNYGCRNGIILSASDIEDNKDGDWSDRCPPCLENIDSRDSCTPVNDANQGGEQ